MKNFIAALAVTGLATAALGQVGSGGTITDGDSSFSLGEYTGDGSGTGPLSDFSVDAGASNTDHLFQTWWWFRLAGDARETAFSGATSWSYSGNIARLTYTYPQFRATIQFVVTGVESGLGFLTQTVTLVNTTNAPLMINLFNYQDLDMAETSSNDAADQSGVNIISVNDTASDWRAEYEGTNAFQVASFDNIREFLSDGNLDNLNGTGLPFGPGDWTGAYQWSFTLNPRGAASASATTTIVPAPGAAGLLGLAGLVAARRRRG
ncbi:MAG: hypothetical protein SFZ23_09725 [Planctomycetota bacterium]|nr:hypothetical protein [Planctomycetota bacterium]